MHNFKPAIVAHNVDRAIFENEIKPLDAPVVLKGLVADWECVRLAKESPEVLGRYLKQNDAGEPVNIALLQKEFSGRYFYNEDLSGFNFTQHRQNLSRMVDWCLAGKTGDVRDSVYIQAHNVDSVFPDMAKNLDMPLLDHKVRPKVWLANTLRTQTHFDTFSNIACHVSGEKTFTLFAPDQVGNLYPGPIEATPAGVPISMVELDDPDFERFPRFRLALEAAVQAKLEPGDALYIPAMWWHHVQTTGPLNMLVNYWWNEGRVDVAPPFTALFMAALSYNHLPPPEKRAWQALVNHYVFETHGDPMAHLPRSAHGVFSHNMSADQMRAYQVAFKRAVAS